MRSDEVETVLDAAWAEVAPAVTGAVEAFAAAGAPVPETDPSVAEARDRRVLEVLFAGADLPERIEPGGLSPATERLGNSMLARAKELLAPEDETADAVDVVAVLRALSAALADDERAELAWAVADCAVGALDESLGKVEVAVSATHGPSPEAWPGERGGLERMLRAYIGALTMAANLADFAGEPESADSDRSRAAAVAEAFGMVPVGNAAREWGIIGAASAGRLLPWAAELAESGTLAARRQGMLDTLLAQIGQLATGKTFARPQTPPGTHSRASVIDGMVPRFLWYGITPSGLAEGATALAWPDRPVFNREGVSAAVGVRKAFETLGRPTAIAAADVVYGAAIAGTIETLGGERAPSAAQGVPYASAGALTALAQRVRPTLTLRLAERVSLDAAADLGAPDLALELLETFQATDTWEANPAPMTAPPLLAPAAGQVAARTAQALAASRHGWPRDRTQLSLTEGWPAPGGDRPTLLLTALEEGEAGVDVGWRWLTGAEPSPAAGSIRRVDSLADALAALEAIVPLPRAGESHQDVVWRTRQWITAGSGVVAEAMDALGEALIGADLFAELRRAAQSAGGPVRVRVRAGRRLARIPWPLLRDESGPMAACADVTLDVPWDAAIAEPAVDGPDDLGMPTSWTVGIARRTAYEAPEDCLAQIQERAGEGGRLIVATAWPMIADPTLADIGLGPEHVDEWEVRASMALLTADPIAQMGKEIRDAWAAWEREPGPATAPANWAGLMTFTAPDASAVTTVELS